MLGVNGFPVAAWLLAEVAKVLARGKKAATEQEIKAEPLAERVAEETIRKADEAGELPPPSETAPPRTANVPVPAVRSSAMSNDSKTPPKASTVADQTIRVNVKLLENLMTLVSELVLIRNQLLQMVRGSDDSEFVVFLQRLSHITTDLQERAMKTRMQPIGNAWAKLPRIMRDLALETGKRIDLQMHGAETELDRQVLELIKDLLTHMIRNSADHGLRTPVDRVVAGKPETGIISLNAYHEGGHIIIEVSDSGRGLNIKRIREKILANGLASESDVENMGDQQAGPAHLQGRFFDRRESDCRFQPGREHGRSQDQYRKNRWHYRAENQGRPRFDLHHQDSAHACHRLGPDHRMRQ